MSDFQATHQERVAYFRKYPPQMGSAATEYRRGLAGFPRALSAKGSIGHSAFVAGRKNRAGHCATCGTEYDTGRRDDERSFQHRTNQRV